MKRARKSESLTGGTGDVNPQKFVMRVAQTGADTSTLGQIPLPVPRTPTSAGEATVMEILKVFFYINNLNTPPPGLDSEIILQLTTNPNSITTRDTLLADPRSVTRWSSKIQAGAVPPAGQDTPVQYKLSKAVDLTDGAGHGFLVAVDNLGLQVWSDGTGVTNVGYCDILYRLKKIGVIEYIGIVQSQQ